MTDGSFRILRRLFATEKRASNDISFYMMSIRDSHFVKNVVTVATGIIGSQIISLIFTPLLTRLYGPEAFGAVAAFTAVVNIITPFSSLGFANAVVMPATEEGATAVARLSILSAAFVAPVGLILVWLFKPHIARWTGMEASPDFLYLIPVSMLLGALLSVGSQAAIREGLYKAKAASSLRSTLVMNLGKMVGGLAAPTGLVLITMTLIGSGLNYTMLLSRVPWRGAFEVRRWFGTKGIYQAAISYYDFAIYRMPQSVINAASFGFPVILLTRLFGSSVAGQYSITTLILSAPVVLIGQSVGEVFFPTITRVVRTDTRDVMKILSRATWMMAAIAIIPFGVVAVAGHVLVPFALGHQWGRAGEFSQPVALWMASVLISRPAVSAIPALRLQGTLLVYEILTTLARVGALYLGHRFGNDLTAIRAFSAINVVGYILLMGMVMVKASVISRKCSDV